MARVEITYFAHGTTLNNEKGRMTGWKHSPLSKLGRRQCADLGSQVENKQFDVVFCSDLPRAIDSARLAFGRKYKIIPTRLLREANVGDFEGMPSSEFHRRMPNHIETPFPNGENYKAAEKRVAKFLKRLKKEYAGQRVAIVAHQAPQLALDVLLKGRTWQQAMAEDWRHKKEWKPGWEYQLEF